MCGIAGIVASDRLARRRARAARSDAGRHHASRTGRRRDSSSTGTRASVHRRLSIVDLAAGHQPLGQRGRHRLDRLQRRDLQPRRHPAGARSARPPVPHALRHGDDRPRLRAVGRRVRRALPRHVRVRDLGRAAAAAAAGARSAGRSSRSTGPRADGRLLFGSEIKSILESGLVRAEANERAIPELLSTRYLSGAETLFKGIHRLHARPRAGLRGRRGSRSRSGGTCRSARRDPEVARPLRRRGRRAVPRAARRRGADAADGRRAARHVPLGRPRQQRDRAR